MDVWPFTNILLEAFRTASQTYPDLYSSAVNFLDQDVENCDIDVNNIFGGWATNNNSQAQELISRLIQTHPILGSPEYQFPLDAYLRDFEDISISDFIDIEAFNISQRPLVTMLENQQAPFNPTAVAEEFFRHMDRLDGPLSHLPKVKYLHAFFRNLGKQGVSLYIEENHFVESYGGTWPNYEIIFDDYTFVERKILGYAESVYNKGFKSTNLIQQTSVIEALQKVLPGLLIDLDNFSAAIDTFVESGHLPYFFTGPIIIQQ